MDLHLWLKDLLSSLFGNHVSTLILTYLFLHLTHLEKRLKHALGDDINISFTPFLNMKMLKYGKRLYTWKHGMFTYKISRNNSYVKLMTNGSKTWLKKWSTKEKKKVCELAECGLEMFISEILKRDSKSTKYTDKERRARSYEVAQIQDNHTAKKLRL